MNESQYLYLSHNVSNLVYHVVCPVKYRRVVFDEPLDEKIRQICFEIEKRFDYIRFLEIGTERIKSLVFLIIFSMKIINLFLFTTIMHKSI